MDSIQVRSGKVVFDLDSGKKVEVGLTSAILAIHDIRLKYKPLYESQQAKQFDYLTDFRAWLAKSNPDVELDLDELDAVWDACEVEYDLQKKTRLGLPTSRTATDSPPTD